MTEALLTVSGLEAGYGPHVVMSDISLSVDSASTVVVLGPNGHGKTTLARAISGVVPIRAGSVQFRGESLEGRSAAQIVQAGIVHIPQGDLLFPEMSVTDNLLAAVASSPAEWRRRRQRLSEVLELFPRLAERRQQLAGTMSGGERRMLAIGRGLMGSSQLLIVDEPALGLAPIVVDEVYAQLRQISETGRAILLVEESAERVGIADQVYVLKNGRLSDAQTPDEILGDSQLVETYFLGR